MIQRLLILLPFILLTFLSRAQKLTEAEVIGEWDVKSVTYIVNNIPKERKQMAEQLRKSMLNSKFKFTKDHTFFFDSPNSEMKEMLNNKHWKINPANDAIHVQEFKDKDKPKPLVMDLIIKKEGDKVFFLSDMPVIIEVEKVL